MHLRAGPPRMGAQSRCLWQRLLPILATRAAVRAARTLGTVGLKASRKVRCAVFATVKRRAKSVSFLRAIAQARSGSFIKVVCSSGSKAMVTFAKSVFYELGLLVMASSHASPILIMAKNQNLIMITKLKKVIFVRSLLKLGET